MDLGKAAGAPVFVEIAGKQYRAKPQTLRMLAELTSWAQGRMRNPMIGLAEFLESPPSRKREREAVAAQLALQDAEAAALKADADAAKTEGREPDVAGAMRSVDADLRIRGEEARGWQLAKQLREAQAYQDYYSPPQLFDPKLDSIAYGVEGCAYSLWLGLHALPENRETWPDHLAVLGAFGRDTMAEMIREHDRWVQASNEDPLKNGKSPAPATTAAGQD